VGCPRAQGATVPGGNAAMYGGVTGVAAAVRGGDIAQPCHNGLWESNLLDDGTLIRIIDWEYAGMGDVHFDLANLAAHNRFSEAQDEALLHAYFGTVSRAAVARIERLKIAAELREAMWAVAAQDLDATAASGFDCPGYARTHFDRCRQLLRNLRL